MKWTVLVDNRTNDPVLETEHGLSIFLETGVLWLSPRVEYRLTEHGKRLYGIVYQMPSIAHPKNRHKVTQNL